MRYLTDEPKRIYVVTPRGEIKCARIAEGLNSRYVDSRGRLRAAAEREGYKLLQSFAKERPGFIAAYTAYCEAAERGEDVQPPPEDWIPPSILKLRTKASKSWSWPARA